MEFLGWIKRGMASRGKLGGLSDELTGFLFDENGLYEYKSPPVPMRIEGDRSAIGSGAQAALGAIRMGSDPARAVEIACGIDPYCSGSKTVGALTG